MGLVELDKSRLRSIGVSNIELSKYIFEQRPDLHYRSKLLALALLKHRNQASLACFPSVRTLQRETGLCRQFIANALDELESKQVILINRGYERGRRGGRRVNHYLFLYDAVAAYSAVAEGGMNTDLAPEEEAMLRNYMER